MLERILIAGMGSIGRRHARIARELIPEIQIAGWRHTPGAPLPPEVDLVVTSLEDAIAFAPQLAVIASPAVVHLEAALPLAEAGVNVLVEKPISTSAVGVAKLIETCELHGVVLTVGYNMRFMPSLLCLRDLLQAGRIGRITSVRSEVGQHLSSWRPETDYRDSVSARSVLGGGVLLELSHEIDYLRWLFGEVRWVSAIALRQSSLEIDVEDTAHIVIGFTGRNDAPPIVASLNMDFVRHDSTRRCEVIGENGTIRWNGVTGTVEIFERGGSDWSTVFAQVPKRDETYVAEWRHVMACIEHAAAPAISGADGLAVIEIIDAARRSASQGCVVSLDGEVPPKTSARQ